MKICEKVALEVKTEGIVTADVTGEMWVGGLILGKTTKPLSTTVATEWATRLLR